MVDIVGGAAAIQPPKITGPTAQRKVVRGPDGTPHVVYVDSQTGAELQNLGGYQILEGGVNSNLDDLGLNPTEEKEPKDTVAQTTIKSTDPRDLIGRGSDRDGAQSKGIAAGRTDANNYGYVNKPSGSGFANMLPGPAGMIAKGVNTAINANNTAAVSAARNRMGLPDQGLGSKVKSTLKDMKGKVADVKVGTGTYPVGLEAVDARGMTTMTPDEAAKRAAANKTKIDLATPDDISAMERRFEDEYGKPGVLGSFKAAAGKFIDDLFTTQDEVREKEAYQRSVNQNSGSNFSPTKSGFADMLGAEQSGVGKEATSTPGYGVSGASRSTAGKTGSSTSGSGSGSDRGGYGVSGSTSSTAGTTSGHGPGIGRA